MATPDFEALLETLVPVGKQRVQEEEDEFLPFAAAVTEDKEIKYVGPETETEFPSPPDALQFLNAGLKKLAEEGTIHASAVVAPVRVQLPDHEEETEAIQLHLEHHEGTARNVYLPFHVEGMSEKIEWGEPFEMDDHCQVFE